MSFKNNLFLLNIFLGLLLPYFVCAQEASFMPTELIAAPGETKTNNISTGSSESLRVGTSSSFGANVNVSSSPRFTTNAESSVKAISGTFKSSFGGSLDESNPISIDVGSLRSSGTGLHSTDNHQITSSMSSLAEGDANISGIFAESSLELDPDQITEVKITPKSDEAKETSNVQTASSNAGQNLTNSLNVDITNTEFKNAFSQAF